MAYVLPPRRLRRQGGVTIISATATFVSHNAKALAGATSTTSSATSAAALWH